MFDYPVNPSGLTTEQGIRSIYGYLTTLIDELQIKTNELESRLEALEQKEDQ